MSVIDKVRSEVVLVGTAVIAVDEALAPLLPEPYQSAAQVAVPILVGVVARAKVFPVAKAEALIVRIKAAFAPHATEAQPTVVKAVTPQVSNSPLSPPPFTP